MTMNMFRDCMNLLDEVRLLSLGVKSPATKTPTKGRDKKSDLTATPDDRKKRTLEDTPLSSNKRRKR